MKEILPYLLGVYVVTLIIARIITSRIDKDNEEV